MQCGRYYFLATHASCGITRILPAVNLLFFRRGSRCSLVFLSLSRSVFSQYTYHSHSQPSPTLTMKAAVLRATGHPFRNFEVGETSMPVPGDNDVLIKVMCTLWAEPLTRPCLHVQDFRGRLF